MKSFRMLALLTSACLLAISAAAHSVWIEPGPEGVLVVRFAEPDGKMERSPGHLDSLTLPVAWVAISGSGATNRAVPVSKHSDHFLLAGTAVGDSAQAETAFDVMGTPGPSARRPYFYARWQPAGGGAGKPSLNLDIVPTADAGRVQVCFRGRPLPGVKATLRTPDEKESELVADGDGFLTFPVNQSGFYLVTVARHRETAGGFAGGAEYGLTSHNASLTWVQP
ncbi:MAG: hypothetical protein KIT22_06250 [Verrucomicrobiae bacterium]|nr:hypothetical protein [Verrucomicrobiae bacterium]